MLYIAQKVFANNTRVSMNEEISWNFFSHSNQTEFHTERVQIERDFIRKKEKTCCC